VTIDGCKGSRSSESMTAAVWDVRVCIGIPKLLRESKIDDVRQVCMLAGTHDDITRFKVAVNKVVRMDMLQATELPQHKLVRVMKMLHVTHQLASKQQDSSQRETKMALNKEVVEGRAKAFNHHRIEASFPTKPMDARDTNPSAKLHVDAKFMIQGMVPPFH